MSVRSPRASGGHAPVCDDREGLSLHSEAAVVGYDVVPLATYPTILYHTNVTFIHQMYCQSPNPLTMLRKWDFGYMDILSAFNFNIIKNYNEVENIRQI